MFLIVNTSLLKHFANKYNSYVMNLCYDFILLTRFFIIWSPSSVICLKYCTKFFLLEENHSFSVIEVRLNLSYLQKKTLPIYYYFLIHVVYVPTAYIPGLNINYNFKSIRKPKYVNFRKRRNPQCSLLYIRTERWWSVRGVFTVWEVVAPTL